MFLSPVAPKRQLDRFRWFQWLKNHPKASGGGGIGLAFAIVLKGIDWEIDGAVRSAALALLIAWMVFGLVLYISSHWDKRRPLIMATQIVLGFGLIAVWKAYLPPPPTAPIALSPQVVEPRIVMPVAAGWRGMLVPSNEATPLNACSDEKLEPGSLLVLFGNQVAVLGPPDERTVIIRIAGEDVLSFVRRDGEIGLDSTIRRQSGEVVARIENNEFKLASSEDYYMERPDAHTLTVVSPDKVPVLYVKYLNRSTLEFRGVFYYPGRDPLVVRSGVTLPRDIAYVENCFGIDGPIFKLP